MAKRPPPRGASRKPASRPKSPHQSPRYGARPRPSQASARPKASDGRASSRLRRKPLLLGLLLLALIAGLLWGLTREPRPPVPMPPAALATDSEPAPASPPPAPAPARAVDNLEFYDILPHERILPERQPATLPPPRPQGQVATIPPGPQHWLQVGQFRQEAMAVFRHEKLVNAGLPARVETQQVDGEARFRVLAGPFASTALRQQAREQIGGLGLEATPVHYQGVSP